MIFKFYQSKKHLVLKIVLNVFSISPIYIFTLTQSDYIYNKYRHLLYNNPKMQQRGFPVAIKNSSKLNYLDELNLLFIP